MVAFGFTTPLLVSEDNELIAGHGRYQAAKLLGLPEVPVIVVADLSPAKRRALAIADNKIAANAGWDRELLAIEIPELTDLLSAEGLDISILGFEPVEFDNLQIDFEERAADPQDHIDPKWCEAVAVSKPGDFWLLGNHKLLCGDARSAEDIARLMASDRADMAFLDPLANKHNSCPDFLRFLSISLGTAASVSRDGAVHFVCADWRNSVEFIVAAKPIYGEPIDVAVWEKSKADQGSFYRGQLEFIGVYRVGKTPHLNIKQGRHKRSRSNVWHYAGVNSFHGMDELRSHPKPVALIADAIKDCTRKGDIVLDIFSSWGSTVMAAEQVGRHARALELEPLYVDVTIRRWQALTHIRFMLRKLCNP